MHLNGVLTSSLPGCLALHALGKGEVEGARKRQPGSLNLDKCARKLNCPVQWCWTKNTRRRRSNFRQDLANPFGNHVGWRERERERERDGRKRYRAFPDDGRGRTWTARRRRRRQRKKREKRANEQILGKFCARYSSFSLDSFSFPPSYWNLSAVYEKIAAVRKDGSRSKTWSLRARPPSSGERRNAKTVLSDWNCLLQ